MCLEKNELYRHPDPNPVLVGMMNRSMDEEFSLSTMQSYGQQNF